MENYMETYMQTTRVVELEVGDHSKDGHNQSDLYKIRTNIPSDRLVKSLNEVAILGDLLSEYEINTISKEDYNELIVNLPLLRPWFEDDRLEFELNPRYRLSNTVDKYSDTIDDFYCDNYFGMFFYYIKVSNPGYICEIVEGSEWYSIGGYGLYY